MVEIVDTLCGDCEELEYKYEYHFPNPAKWFWYCKALKVKLAQHSGVRRDVRCPKNRVA